MTRTAPQNDPLYEATAWRPKRFTPRVGGRFDKVLGVLRMVLPMAAGVLIVVTGAYPLLSKQENSFVLSRNGIATSQERLRMVNPRYSGLDNESRPFTVAAASAVQPRGVIDQVALTGITARMNLADAVVVVVTADEGTYYPDDETLILPGPVTVESSNGYRIDTTNAQVNLTERLVASKTQVESAGPLGRFIAQGFQARLDDDTLAFDGRVRAMIVPNGPNLPLLPNPSAGLSSN